MKLITFEGLLVGLPVQKYFCSELSKYLCTRYELQLETGIHCMSSPSKTSSAKQWGHGGMSLC